MLGVHHSVLAWYFNIKGGDTLVVITKSLSAGAVDSVRQCILSYEFIMYTCTVLINSLYVKFILCRFVGTVSVSGLCLVLRSQLVMLTCPWRIWKWSKSLSSSIASVSVKSQMWSRQQWDLISNMSEHKIGAQSGYCVLVDFITTKNSSCKHSDCPASTGDTECVLV